jgi:hypothetical protein
MRVPSCRVCSVGELSAWGKQFLTALEGSNIAEVSYDLTLAQFCSSPPSPSRLSVLFIENLSDSRQAITKARRSGKRSFVIWFGRNFTKEDLSFALDNRVYTCFEGSKVDEKKVGEGMRKASLSLESAEQFDQLVHSLKALLLQAETDLGAKPLLTEIKTALGKLERCGAQNEFTTGTVVDPAAVADTKVPFHRAQDFGDALTTVHNLERTGALWVKGELPEEEGKVEFIQGKIVSAVVREVRGLKAIYRMFLWDTPRFMFTRRDPQDTVMEEHLNYSMKFICSEGDTLRRRFEKIRQELPPAELSVELEPSSLHEGTQLVLNDFLTLASVVELNKVSQIVDYNSLPDVVIYESLIHLKKNNMIRVRL